MSEDEPGGDLVAGHAEESLDAHTAQLVESIVGAFYKPLVEVIGELEDRVQALERRVQELERGSSETGQDR